MKYLGIFYGTDIHIYTGNPSVLGGISLYGKISTNIHNLD